MQWKLPTPGRLTDRIHRWLLSWGFPLLARLAVAWSRPWLFAGARVVIFFVMAVYPAAGRAVAGNLARILGEPAGSRRVRRARRRMYHHFAYYWVDLFRFPQLPAAAAEKHLSSVEGLDRVGEALEEGRGAILLTGHLGNWEMGSVLLGQRDWPVSVVYVKDKFAEAESFRSQLRTEGRVEEIPLEIGSGWGSLPVLRALRENRIVAMQGDRDFDGQGVRAPFFGESVRFPRGPFIVSLLTGAPILPTFLTYDERLDFEARFFEPIRPMRTGDREGDLSRAVGAWARILEQVVANHPDQWYTFFDYWEDAESSASGERADRRPPS